MSVLPIGMSGEAGAYQIQRSVRLNSSDSSYFSRTPANAGNRKTWTWSGWVKRSTLGQKHIFGAYTGSGSDTNLFVVQFNSSNQIAIDAFTQNWRVTSAVYRDVSSWYHIVVAFDTTQSTASNRIKLYVNGEQVTAFGTSNDPSLNTDYVVNSTNAHYLGVNAFTGNTVYFDGYLADAYLIDGQALTPSSFGETDTTTGVWKPKQYTGSYGTNGFNLKFADNSGTTSTTLGKDSSSNGNNWTPNNFSVTAGAGNDSLVDTPTPYGTDTGVGGEVRGNYCTWNPLAVTAANSTFSNGNLDVVTPNVGGNAFATFQIPSTGKWYFEVTPTVAANAYIGVSAYTVGSTYLWQNTNHVFYRENGNKSVDGSNSAYGASYTNNDVIGVACDSDAGTITFYKNNSSQGSISHTMSGMFPAITDGASESGCTCVANFGQRPFAYTAPSGFKALCTQNLPTPTVVQGDDYFNTVLYTGTGATRSVTGVGFQPDFVWIKQRNSTRNHNVYDAVRGALKVLQTNVTDQEVNYASSLTSFDSDGFSLGSATDPNANTGTYVAWNWKAGSSTVTNTAGSISSQVRANPTAGFSIVTYTGTGSLGTVGHGLGVKPSFILTKSRSTTEGWGGYHKSLGASYGIFLELTDAAYAASNYWNNTEPTSTVFTVNVNRTNNGTMVAYCFAEVPGFSAFGSYTGNGSADGPFVYLGFRPAFVLTKASSSSSDGRWLIRDDIRNTYNPVVNALYPNYSNAEDTTPSYWAVDFCSNGFKIRVADTSNNQSNVTFIYAAFAENPFKYSLAR